MRYFRKFAIYTKAKGGYKTRPRSIVLSGFQNGICRVKNHADNHCKQRECEELKEQEFHDPEYDHKTDYQNQKSKQEFHLENHLI